MTGILAPIISVCIDMRVDGQLVVHEQEEAEAKAAREMGGQ